MPRYWVMRTDRSRKAELWREVEAGRLRQGWGWLPEQDLELIADLRRAGRPLGEAQYAAWRGNRRLLSTEPGEVRQGDVILLPHLPREGRWSVVRVAGRYRYEISNIENAVFNAGDYGHILPVEVVADFIDPRDARVSDRLRRSVRNRQRMWNIDGVGEDVERLVRAMGPRTP